jgi:V8-like Glu-specific endopeptidase
MNLPSRILIATTIGLTITLTIVPPNRATPSVQPSSVQPSSVQPPSVQPPSAQLPSLTLATEAAIADLPSNSEPFTPKDLFQDREPRPTRGVICKPSQKSCDDRLPQLSQSYPWSAIGRLQIGKNGHCTATLIDRDWILTNAHCVVSRETKKVVAEPMAFLPNLIDGKLRTDADRANVIKVISGTNFKDNNEIPHPNDWAILKIDQPLGEKYGSIGWRVIPSTLLIKNRRKFTLAGYSSDFPNRQKYADLTSGEGYTAGIHKGCSITGEETNKILIHDCDTRSGSSGSAIIGWLDDQPYIVAINNAESIDRLTGKAIENYAINVNRIREWFTQQQNRK